MSRELSDNEKKMAEIIALHIIREKQLCEALSNALQILEQTKVYREANDLTIGNVFLDSTIEEIKKVL